MKGKIALVTGATGFIGSRLVARLVEMGWSVHVIVRENSKLDEIQSIIEKIQVHVYKGNTQELIDIVGISSPDIVFHLASLFIARHKSDEVSSIIDSNLKFPTQLLEAMSVNGVKYLINTGTSWEYADSDKYNPVCLYAATKHAFESLMEYYVQSYELRTITLKLFDTYGPRDPRKKIISLLSRIASSGEIFSMSPGEQEIDLVYIDDVIDAYLIAANEVIKIFPGLRHYDISSQAPITLKKLVNEFGKISNQKMNIAWGTLPYREREIMKCSRKLKILPGWKPKISLTDGLNHIRELSLKNE